MVISPASSPNSHLREDDDLGDKFAVCSAKKNEARGEEEEKKRQTGKEKRWIKAVNDFTGGEAAELSDKFL